MTIFERKNMEDIVLSLFPSRTNLNIVSLIDESNDYSGDAEKLITYRYMYRDEREQGEFDRLCELLNGQIEK